MNYQKITPISIADGTGCRVILWVSGCGHHCLGCHNPETHDPQSGLIFTCYVESHLMELLEPDYIDGITLSGGDPLYPENRDRITLLAKRIKETYPNKTIWLYTGYLYEQVSDLEVMKYIDVLVDGPYIASKRCVGKFYGSTNQRIIFLKNAEVQRIDYENYQKGRN